MMQCTLIFIALLFVLFLVGVGVLTFGKIDICNIRPKDFLTVWTLQVTFSTILLAVGGFIINFFNEKILGIPLSEISKKKGIWNIFLYVTIFTIIPIVIYIAFNVASSKFYLSKNLEIYIFSIYLIIFLISLGLTYTFVCKVLNLLLNRDKLKEELKQEIRNSLLNFLLSNRRDRNATNS